MASNRTWEKTPLDKTMYLMPKFCTRDSHNLTCMIKAFWLAFVDPERRGDMCFICMHILLVFTFFYGSLKRDLWSKEIIVCAAAMGSGIKVHWPYDKRDNSHLDKSLFLHMLNCQLTVNSLFYALSS